MRIDNLHSRIPEARNESKRLSEATSNFLTWAHGCLKTNGWERTDDSRRSAMFEKVYKRGQREVVLSGWHGTGAKGTCRNYGDLKMIFALGDNWPGETGEPYSYAREQLKLDIINGTVQDADDFMVTVKGYIMALCRGTK